MTDPTLPQTAAPEFAPYNPYAPALQPKKPAALGKVAFFLGLAVFLVSLVVSALNAVGAAPYAITSNGLSYNTNLGSNDPQEVAVSIAVMAHLLIGTLAGITALVLGIVAIATNRGRAFGVVGAILAFLAPGLSLLLFFVVLVSSV